MHSHPFGNHSDDSVAQPGETPEWLTEAVMTMMRTGRIPGLSLVVVDSQRSLYAGGFGTADLATGAPATPATVYLWFSMTKIVTATAAVMRTVSLPRRPDVSTNGSEGGRRPYGLPSGGAANPSSPASRGMSCRAARYASVS